MRAESNRNSSIGETTACRAATAESHQSRCSGLTSAKLPAGTKIEVPIKRLFAGVDPSRVDRGALANPDALDWFVEQARRFRGNRDARIVDHEPVQASD